MANTALLEALSHGRREREAGRLEAALGWFERAARIAPWDAAVTLELAQSLVLSGHPRGLALYRELSGRVEIREIWLGLAAAALRDGAAEEAAAALARGLGGYTHDANEIAAIADAVAHAVGGPGWCAIDGAGILAIGAARGTVRTEIDGAPVTSRARRGRVRLPDGWERAGEITVIAGGRHLLGSPVAVGRIMRIEGFVESVDGDLRGWAWCPRDPDRNPVLDVTGDGPPLTIEADDTMAEIETAQPFARPRGFHIAADRLRTFSGPLRVTGPDGRNLTGSPLDPSLERVSAERAAAMVAGLFPAPGMAATAARAVPLTAVPAHIIGGPPVGGEVRRPVDVVVPVYGGLQHALACIGSARAGLPDWARLVVVDDGSPDPAVVRGLAPLAERGEIILLAQGRNRGFPGAANIGMRHDAGRDVVLLNSDTLTPPGWLERLREAAYSAPEIGTVTPISNDATILSYPSIDAQNPVPDLARTTALDAQTRRVNADALVEIPTAIGFCMYIKRDCLEAAGLLREDVFAQGYGEENDFCLRARHLGWRHVAAPGVFVAHVGGQSFGAAKAHLVRRNMRLINRLHPGYDALVQAWQRADPMAGARRRLDIARWEEAREGRRSVLLVTHGRGGGVQRRVAERAAALRAEGLRPIVIWPVGRLGGVGRDCVLGDGPEGGTPNLRFAVPEELEPLSALLRRDRPLRAEVHHLIGHDHTLLSLFTRLKIPYEVVIHDYSWFCPRINLVGIGDRYCGEPDLAGCEACIADLGTTNDEATPPTELCRRSAAELAAASRVVVPSQDVAARMRRHFPAIAPVVEAWKSDAALPPPAFYPLVDGEIRICLVGAIGIEKGYDIVLACARDAAQRKLPIGFRLVGHSRDDARLLATGRVHITGRYEEHEVVELIRAQSAQLAWLPSLWPETWCYTLSHAWAAGLHAVAFDIGTPAARIRATGRGWVVPLGMPPAALNLQFMRLAERAVASHLPADPPARPLAVT